MRLSRLRHLLLLLLAAGMIGGCSNRRPVHQIGTLQAEDDRFWEVVPRETRIERIGIDFQFTEGPAWHPDGKLLLSDIPANTIYQWEGRKYRIFRQPSNHSNGLLVEPGGTVLVCEHGTRSLSRIRNNGERQVLAESFRGKRLNSPNDLCKSPDGSIYFTDPPWGLPGRNEDSAKEIPFNGVYRLKNGEVSLVDSTLSWPNGIALSPDARFLYVANLEILQVNGEDQYQVFWMRYRLGSNGLPEEKSIFFTAPDTELPGGPDGMKVDSKGNLFLTGPGGILVVNPQGEHLGTIGIPIPATNLAFGPREKTLYVTARSTVVRINLK